jgi:tetratricopeptide (TPR) repeat protein
MGSFDVRLFPLGLTNSFFSVEAALQQVVQGELDFVRGGFLRKLLTKNVRVRNQLESLTISGFAARRATAEYDNRVAGTVLHRMDVVDAEGVLFAVISVLFSTSGSAFPAQTTVDRLIATIRIGETDDAHPAASIDEANASYERGNSLLASRGFGDAIECFEHAVGCNPSFAQAWNNLAWCRMMTRRDLERALKEVGTAIALAPDVPNMYDTRSKIRALLGDLIGSRADDAEIARLRRAGHKDW